MSFRTPSNSSPKGGGIRACLCPNGRYSRKCCDGSLHAQGIGNITRVPIEPSYLLQQNGDFILQQDGGKLILNINE